MYEETRTTEIKCLHDKEHVFQCNGTRFYTCALTGKHILSNTYTCLFCDKQALQFHTERNDKLICTILYKEKKTYA